MASDDRTQATNSHPKTSPLCHDKLILSLRLESIMKLEGKNFVCAWLVSGHYALWQSGERPITPCLRSLTVAASAGTSGVFVDWDSAALTRTGNSIGEPAFLALDMPCKARPPRLYDHDLEAFIWVLPWKFLQYDRGCRIGFALRSWESADYEIVRDAKSGFQLLTWARSEQIRRDDAEYGYLQSLCGKTDPGCHIDLEVPVGTGKLVEYIKRQRSAPQVAQREEKNPAQVYEELLVCHEIFISDAMVLARLYFCHPYVTSANENGALNRLDERFPANLTLSPWSQINKLLSEHQYLLVILLVREDVRQS